MTNDPYKWRRRLGGIAGGTLGFIGGDVPGAVMGYKWGREAYKLNPYYQMSLRKRKTVGSYDPHYSTGRQWTPRKRRRTDKPAARPTGKGKWSYAQRGSNSERTAVKRVSKGVKKAKKAVKVSNRLREKIKKVVSDEEIAGAGTHVMYVPPLLAGQTVDNKREYFNFPHLVDNNGTTTQIFRQGELFSPNTVLDAASKLYKSKAATDVLSFLDATNFDAKIFQCEVPYQAAKFWIRNNTGRTYRMCMYVLTVKNSKNANDTTGNFIGMLGNETGNYVTNGNINGFSGVATFNGGYYTTEYKNEPRFYANIRKNFDVKTIDMVLEPGQVVTQYIKGPAQFYDMKKYLENDTYWTLCKGSMWTAFSIMSDPVQAGNIGGTPENKLLYSNEIAASGDLKPQILIEMERITKVKIPEQAGMEAATNTTLSERKENRYFYEEYFPTFAQAITNRRRRDAVLTTEDVN